MKFLRARITVAVVAILFALSQSGCTATAILKCTLVHNNCGQ